MELVLASALRLSFHRGQSLQYFISFEVQRLMRLYLPEICRQRPPGHCSLHMASAQPAFPMNVLLLLASLVS